MFKQNHIDGIITSNQKHPRFTVVKSNSTNQSPFQNPKVHYSTHKSPPLVPTFSQTNPVQSLLPHFFNNHFNVIQLSTPAAYKWPLFFRRSTQSFLTHGLPTSSSLN